MPIFGAKYFSNASNYMKIGFQSFGLILSQILFIINAMILQKEVYALIFFIITVGHLLLGVFLPILFPDSKEFRSFGAELLLLVMIDLWIIKIFFAITIPWLVYIEIAVVVILTGSTIFYSIIYYLNQCKNKTVRLFKEWTNSKLLLAELLLINAILPIIYRDVLILSLFVISLMISMLFATLSLQINQEKGEAKVDHYFILICSAILFIICAFGGEVYLFDQSINLLFLFLITVWNLLLGIFLPIIFPDSKEYRSLSFELLLMVLINLLISWFFFANIVSWLIYIEIAVVAILSGLTIFYSIIYYLDKSEMKTVQLFKQWMNSKLILAELFLIDVILIIVYRDVLMFSLLIISLMISIIFAVLSIQVYHKDRKGTEDHYFILSIVAILFIICAFSTDLFPPTELAFLVILLISFLFMMGVAFVISSGSLIDTTVYLVIQFFVTNYYLNLQNIAGIEWYAIGFYAVSSIIFLIKSYKYNSKQAQEMLFTEINILWALHFYVVKGNSLLNWILLHVVFLMIGKIGLKNINIQKSIKSEEPFNSQSPIKKTFVFHGLQLLVNILVFSYLSYIITYLKAEIFPENTVIWLNYFLFMVFFSVNIPFFTQSKFKSILTLISPLLILVVEIIMPWEPSYVNYLFFILSVVYAAIFLMNSHQKNKESENKLLLLVEIYFIIILTTISCWLTEFPLDIKFGFIFIFILLSLYLNTMFKIQKARIFQLVLIAGVGLSYIIYVLLNVGSPGFRYESLIFLLVGIFLVLGSFIKYRSNLAEMKEISSDSEFNDKKQDFS